MFKNKRILIKFSETILAYKNLQPLHDHQSFQMDPWGQGLQEHRGRQEDQRFQTHHGLPTANRGVLQNCSFKQEAYIILHNLCTNYMHSFIW